MKRHNFSAGPCILPQSVMQKASDAVINFNDLNLSLIEISHRSKDFVEVMENARELVNRVQNIRKEANFELTDKILLQIVDNTNMKDAVNEFSEYICREILATQIDWVSSLEEGVDIEINDQKLKILVRQKG